ncbi:MAG TPA: response regulator [Bryobacteraceae bacterium]|jgi:PAS domain S-box-containing protein
MSNDSQPVILNVDDDEGCRYAVTRTLERSNFRVTEAATGREALRLARLEQPDLVLLDVHLPDMHGFEVCRQLKAEPATASIPVMHITASYLKPSDMAAGLESGADSYLIEPVEPEVLVAAINSILRARRAEESARGMAREWQATFDSISDGVAVVDADGRILRLNESLARLLDRSMADLAGTPCTQLWGALPAEKQPFFRALTSGRRESIELEYESRLLNIVVDPMFDHDAKPAGAVHIVSDITEKRQLEEQFRESQKFETIGTLAAGVAHDFNNLLTSIMGNASLVLGELAENGRFREKLQDVVSASQRAADLTKQLLAYSGKGRHYLQKVAVSELVERIHHLIEAAVPKKVGIELHLAAGLPFIEADANQIQQVVLNLVSNAVEAIADNKGVIAISTGMDGEQVFLEVRDTGCGMSAETRARIFDPFFTTKFTGRGLGLAAVAGIVRGHKAAIHVHSTPGEGSAFRIAFPAAEAPASAASDEAQPAKAAATPATILVADDEEMVRRIAQAALEIRGHHVLLANDGLDAIEQVRKHPEITAVLLDLTMPVMGGEEAIDDIIAANPEVKVIVSTGYDHREAVARFGQKQVAGYLQKPYTSRQLAEKVKQALQGRENARARQ